MKKNSILPKLNFQFESKFVKVGGYKIHYVDEGAGDAILCIHGNPTWSFFFRSVVDRFSKTNRIIALDHLGCGFSDKPQDENEYTLSKHIERLNEFVEKLGLEKLSLCLHDWGGAIGMGFAVANEEKIDKIVLFNSAAFLLKGIPLPIRICRGRYLGRFFVQRLNLFVFGARNFCTRKKLSKDLKKAFSLPYNSYENRKAVYEFVRDIPQEEGDRSYGVLRSIEERLGILCDKEVCVAWGSYDWCFNQRFLDRWREIFSECSDKGIFGGALLAGRCRG